MLKKQGMKLRDPGLAYQAARLRSANLQDLARLTDLYKEARPKSRDIGLDVRAWLERGGALYLENQSGKMLSAVCWTEHNGGWRVDRIATLPSERGQAFGRWLMTKVEALAIRHNIPELSLKLDREDLLPYYERMGYKVIGQEGNCNLLHKRVGGTWQIQSDTAS
jgi:GNAT superfamily N-acetyltransferase